MQFKSNIFLLTASISNLYK